MSVFGSQLEDAAKNVDDVRRSFDVEIGEVKQTVYAKPLTGRDLDKIIKVHPSFTTSPSMNAVVDILILKCELEDGSAAFDKGDKMFLVRRPLGWLSDIREALFGDDDEMTQDQMDEAEKN